MILLDSSVLFDYFRGKDAKLNALIPTLSCALCGAVRAEALKGCRTPAERTKTVNGMNTFGRLTTPEVVWDELGDNLAALRVAGLAVPFPDVLVATVGVRHGVEVWARDRHFPMMQTVLPALRLFAEPP